MGRRRKAWLWGGDGRRIERGRRLPGWYVRYSEYDYRGRRKNRSKHFLRHADAAAWVRRRNALQDLGALGAVTPIPLKDAIGEYFESLDALGDETIRQYRYALAFLYAVTGDVEVSTIRGQSIDRMIADRLEVSRAATVNRHLRGLSRFFGWAMARGYHDRNPVKDITARPRGPAARERPPVTDAQIRRLVSALKTEDHRLAVWLAMTTGLDRGVIARLRSDQIDLERRVIRLVRPKTGRAVVVPIHSSLVPALARRLRSRGSHLPVLEGIAYRRWWKDAVAAARCEGLWFRDLRALAATRLQAAGASLGDAQRLLGHSTPSTTMAHYTIPDPDVVSRLNAARLPGLPTGPESTAGRRGRASRRRLRRA